MISFFSFVASINKGTHVGQPVFSVLFALLSLAGDSPPASKRTKIPRKSKAVRCEAVLPELKCSQTRKRPQRILCVFSRALTPYEGISARQNRMFSCLSMARLANVRAKRVRCGEPQPFQTRAQRSGSRLRACQKYFFDKLKESIAGFELQCSLSSCSITGSFRCG